jgi:hypothetical protein
MIEFCYRHNAIKYEIHWIFAGVKVEELLKRENKPATLVRCPLCMYEDMEERNFFKGDKDGRNPY